jgi:uncharacterized damage-inducible protein DinB
MNDDILGKIFEHNLWANAQIIAACATLNETQYTAPATTATKGTIQETLRHLVGSQAWYLKLLNGEDPPFDKDHTPTFEELAASNEASGEALLALARDLSVKDWDERFTADDGWSFEPWVVMVQLINHAHEHREQIKSMLSAMAITPPEIDGWDYGLAAGSLRMPTGE